MFLEIGCASATMYPLVLQLEPLYQCNLACAGCGKIQHPKDVLQQRMTVQQAVDAVMECGAPVVSIAGGEPLVHKDIDKIVQELVKRKKFVYLCTDALLLSKKMDQFEPSPYSSWSVHVDGTRERHDLPHRGHRLCRWSHLVRAPRRWLPRQSIGSSRK